MYNLVRPVVIDLDGNKIWGSHLSQHLLDGEILIREKGKWNLICLIKYPYFKKRISRTNADD
jgi:hypothetical protein